MNPVDKQRIIERYNGRIEKFGCVFEALASGTEERREIRFRIMTEVGMSDGDSVLDLGCGFGDFFRYVAQKGLKVNYVGYDINPLLIEEARRRYPGVKFEVKDVTSEPFPEFDYIVSTSCFNLKYLHQDNYEYAGEIMKACYEHCRKGVSIDFLSSYVDYESEDGFHYQPERIFGMAKNITKRVCIRNDYPLYEFAVYMYRDFTGWGKKGDEKNTHSRSGTILSKEY